MSAGERGDAEGQDRDKTIGNWNFSILETNMLKN